MNKEEYLQKLEQHLKKYLSKEEIKDILMDYGEYFEDGRRQNKTDIEISAKLGDPEVIASQFIEEIKEEKRKKQEENIEKIKETTSSVVKNIKKTTNDFAQSAKEKINTEAMGEMFNENFDKAKNESKGIISSVLGFCTTIIKAAIFIIICFICIMAVLTILGFLGGAVLLAIGGGIGGLTLCVGIASFISGAMTAAGIFASIFLIAAGILFALLFIIIVYIIIKYLKEGFNFFFIKKGGVNND